MEMQKADVKNLSELAEIIRKHGAITKTKLWKNSSLSIWEIEKIKHYIPEMFSDIIYDKKKSMFISRLVSLSLFTEEEMK